MKSDTVYKRAFNQALEFVSTSPTGALMPSENELSSRIKVSRTTVRKVLRQLEERRIIGMRGAERVVLRGPTAEDAFPDEQTVSTASQVETRFVDFLLSSDLQPGAAINALDLARQFGVSTTGVREFLNRFARFGLIERRPNTRWVFKGFNKDFALELFEVRELFERRSALAFACLPPESPFWARLLQIRGDHDQMLAAIDTRFHEYSKLDNRFHRLVQDASRNRFMDDFYDVMAFIFEYHYQRNEALEKALVGRHLLEHIDYIEALFSRDPVRVDAASRRHLVSARQMLLDTLMPDPARREERIDGSGMVDQIFTP